MKNPKDGIFQGPLKGITQLNSESVMTFAAILVLVIAVSVISCHIIAKRRGSNPVFWGVMGAIFGPLAIPFALVSRPKDEA